METCGLVVVCEGDDLGRTLARWRSANSDALGVVVVDIGATSPRLDRQQLPCPAVYVVVDRAADAVEIGTMVAKEVWGAGVNTFPADTSSAAA